MCDDMSMCDDRLNGQWGSMWNDFNLPVWALTTLQVLTLINIQYIVDYDKTWFTFFFGMNM